MPEEVLKPGALYADCAVVQLRVPLPLPLSEKENLKNKDAGTGTGEGLEIEDDGEFGGEVMGRLVWEAYEEALKKWEEANPPPKEEDRAVAPDVDRGYD